MRSLINLFISDHNFWTRHAKKSIKKAQNIRTRV